MSKYARILHAQYFVIWKIILYVLLTKSEEASLLFYRRDNWDLEQSQDWNYDFRFLVQYSVGAFGELLGSREYLACLLREGVQKFQKDVGRLGRM